MSGHLRREDVHRLVDGDLGPERLPAVERHLDTCDVCRTWVREIRHLTARLGDLTHRVSPTRDLWPDIEGRVRAPVVAEPRPPHGRFPWRALPRGGWRRLAAAAAVVVLVSGVLVLVRIRPNGPTATQSASLPPAADSLVATYQPVVERLRRISADRAVRLAPDLAARLDEDLAVTDHAVSETREALRRSPNDRELLTALARSYRREVGFLEWVLQVTPEGDP